jgi:hypothetical protein
MRMVRNFVANVSRGGVSEPGRRSGAPSAEDELGSREAVDEDGQHFRAARPVHIVKRGWRCCLVQKAPARGIEVVTRIFTGQIAVCLMLVVSGPSAFRPKRPDAAAETRPRICHAQREAALPPRGRTPKPLHHRSRRVTLSAQSRNRRRRYTAGSSLRRLTLSQDGRSEECSQVGATAQVGRIGAA